METRIYNGLWAAICAGFLAFGLVYADLTAYSWVILTGVMLWSLALTIWPDWINNTPDSRMPWVIALMAGWAALFVTWTLLMPTIAIFTKVAAMTVLAAWVAYVASSSLRRRRASRNSV